MKLILIISSFFFASVVSAQTIGKQQIVTRDQKVLVYLPPYYAQSTRTWFPAIFYLSKDTGINIVNSGLSYQLNTGFVPLINDQKCIVFSFHGDSVLIKQLINEFKDSYRIDTTKIYLTRSDFAHIQALVPARDTSVFAFTRNLKTGSVTVCRNDGSKLRFYNVKNATEATDYFTIYFLDGTKKQIIK